MNQRPRCSRPGAAGLRLTSFRHTEVEPQPHELGLAPPQNAGGIRNEVITFPRPITVDTRLISFEHHLDTIFHNARHDVIIPLRETIQVARELHTNPQARPREGPRVSIYKDVQPVTLQANPKLGVSIEFYCPRFEELFKKAGERAFRNRCKTGNLLVLTTDNFTTGIIGCVASAVVDGLKKGRFSASFAFLSEPEIVEASLLS
jgi:hypothetical protein